MRGGDRSINEDVSVKAKVRHEIQEEDDEEGLD